MKFWEERMEVKYENLSNSLKTAVVGMWILIILNAIAFLVGYAGAI